MLYLITWLFIKISEFDILGLSIIEHRQQVLEPFRGTIVFLGQFFDVGCHAKSALKIAPLYPVTEK